MNKNAEPTFAIGTLFNRTWRAFTFNPLFFLGVAAAASLPLGLISYWFSDFDNEFWPTMIWSFAAAIIAQILLAFGWFGALKALKRERADAGDSFSFTAEWFRPLSAATLLYGLVINVGAWFFIVPGLIAACFFCVALEACVIERLGVVECFKRSVYLTRGFRWPLFGLNLLLLIVDYGFYSVAESLILARSGDTGLSAMIAELLGFPLDAFFNVFFVAIYVELKRLKESALINRDQVVGVFD